MSFNARWPNTGIKKMSNSEILEGLKYAIARGESISQAINTFVSAGYPKIEVEDAANELQSQPQEQPTNYSSPQSSLSPSSPQSIKQTSQKPQTSQIASKYDSPAKPSIFHSNVFVIILVVILFMLLGLLAGLFLFKQQVIDFFGSLFPQ